MDINDRISHLIEAKKLTKKEFADKIGVQRSNINHILDGRNKPGYDFLYKTLNAFPDISAEWLMKGDGSVYNAESSVPAEHSPTLFAEERETVASQKKAADSSKKQESDKKKIVDSEEKPDSKTEQEISSDGKIVVFSKKTVINNKNTERINADLENVEKIKPEINENEIESIIIFYRNRTCKQYTFL